MIALLPRSEAQNKKAGQEARPKARTQVERRGPKQESRMMRTLLSQSTLGDVHTTENSFV